MLIMARVLPKPTIQTANLNGKGILQTDILMGWKLLGTKTDKKKVKEIMKKENSMVFTWWHKLEKSPQREIMKMICGLGTWTFWYVNGQKKELSPIKMGKSKDSQKVGTKTEIRSLKLFKGGKLDGLSIRGMKMVKTVEIDYIDGLRNGDAKWWDEKEGYLTCTEKVQNDLKEGPTAWFYKSGAKKEVSHYKAGKYNGISTWWHETGEVSAKGNHENDLRIGTWTWWYVNGQKERVESYKNGKIEGLSQGWHKDGKKRLK